MHDQIKKYGELEQSAKAKFEEPKPRQKADIAMVDMIVNWFIEWQKAISAAKKK